MPEKRKERLGQTVAEDRAAPPLKNGQLPEVPAKWRKQRAKAKSFYDLHQDLDVIVAAWAIDTHGLFSQHTIMELIEWSAARTFGALRVPSTPASASGDGIAGVPDVQRATPNDLQSQSISKGVNDDEER